MRRLITLTFYVLIFATVFMAAQKRSLNDDESFEKTQGYRPPNGYIPDAGTAIKIAEAVLSPVYGEQKIASERPFKAQLLHEGVWRVEGTLHCADGKIGTCPGGTAVVKLAKSDGRVLFMMHYK